MAQVRLQKYFTDCGVMSRRAAEEQIKLGNVRVNGKIAHIGDSIDPAVDTVEYCGEVVLPESDEKICIMLNKPRGYVTTMSDEKGRKNVSMLVSDVGTRVYPVGRLDLDSEGLLLLTNDGELANVLTHPRHSIPKIYHVFVRGEVTSQRLAALNSSMTLDGYKILPVKTEIIKKPESDGGTTALQMTLFEGRNRQIRKMCESQSLKVVRLMRVAIGELQMKPLKSGKWRKLTKKEINYLKQPSHKTKGHQNA